MVAFLLGIWLKNYSVSCLRKSKTKAEWWLVYREFAFKTSLTKSSSVNHVVYQVAISSRSFIKVINKTAPRCWKITRYSFLSLPLMRMGKKAVVWHT